LGSGVTGVQINTKEGTKSRWLGSQKQHITGKVKIPQEVETIRLNVYNNTYVNYLQFKSRTGERTEVKHAISDTWTEFKLRPGERIVGAYGSSFLKHNSELLKSLGFIIE